MQHPRRPVRPTLACFATALVLLIGSSVQEEAQGADRKRAMETIVADELLDIVEHLASDELKGRYYLSAEARSAAEFIAERFQAAGLTPLGDEGSWFQSIGIEGAAPNVVGVRRGRGEYYLLVTAHYDHLQPAESGEDRIYNGADDNASGTAAIIAVAEAFEALDADLEASVVFVAFTAEEAGLRGSRYLVEHPPLELSNALGVVNLDMISRGEPDLLFCEGGVTAPDLLGAAKRANETVGLEIRYDVHPEWLRQSDQWSFLQKGVPALYFGVEDHPDYHQVSDHADKILPDLLEKVARLAFLLTSDVACAPGEPKHVEPMEGRRRRVKEQEEGD